VGALSSSEEHVRAVLDGLARGTASVARSNEGIDEIGRGLAIAAHAVALIEKI
jgi:hypothetical protein